MTKIRSIVRNISIAVAVLGIPNAFAAQRWIDCTLTEQHTGSGTVGINDLMTFMYDDERQVLGYYYSADLYGCDGAKFDPSGGNIQGGCATPRSKVYVSISKGSGKIEVSPMNGMEILNFPWSAGSCEPGQPRPRAFGG